MWLELQTRWKHAVKPSNISPFQHLYVFVILDVFKVNRVLTWVLWGIKSNNKISALFHDECGFITFWTTNSWWHTCRLTQWLVCGETADCVININSSKIIEANVFKFSKMCRECEPFSETLSKLGAIQGQIVFFVTDFRQRSDCLNPKQRECSQWVGIQLPWIALAGCWVFQFL